MPLIHLTNGGFRYSGTNRWIFRGLDFAVSAGEAVHVTGRNGSGKTTLLKVIAHILPLTEGEFQSQGGGVAYMDQFAGEMLARDLTVAEQVKMATAIKNGAFSSLALMLDEFDVGLRERTTDFVGFLSGGQRQIVALLCTLAAGATVLCLDEFTASMDDHSASVANTILERVRGTMQTALVLVSHSSVGIRVDREFSPLVEAR